MAQRPDRDLCKRGEFTDFQHEMVVKALRNRRVKENLTLVLQVPTSAIEHP
jgi:hypothetical protein